MNIEFFLLMKKHTDTLIEQTKTRPEETLEFVMNTQMQIFSYNPPINLVEEVKWLVAVTYFSTTNSVVDITNENNSVSITTPSHWNSKSVEKTINELNILIERRSEKDIDLHVEKVRKKGIILVNDYSLSSLGTFKNKRLEELKTAKYNDDEDMVYRFQLAYDEFIDKLDLNCNPTTTIGYTLPLGIYEFIDINLMLKYLLPKDVKVYFTIDDIRLKSKSNTNKTIKFIKKTFFYIFRGFTQSHLGELGEIDGLVN